MSASAQRRRRASLIPLLALAGSLSWAVAAVPPARASDVQVAILDPGPFNAVSGKVHVRIQVESKDPVQRVRLYIDDRLVTVLIQPPWEVTVDVGNENVEHVFRAVALTSKGETGEMAIQTPAIEVDEVVEVPLQQLYITVTQGGQRVTGLPREDFTVLDDGTPQDLVTFEGGDAPLTAVLLVDSSESMKGERLAAAIRGAEAFTSGMKDLDEAMSVLFSDRLIRATPFTDDPAVLRSSLEGARAVGGTALTDYLYSAFKILDGRQGRRVIVILSDGFDVYSALDMKDALWKAQRSQAIVYWLQLHDRTQPDAEPGLFTSSWRDAQQNQEQFETLRKLVLDSGGRIEPIDDVSQVENAFRSILAELREQYVIGYYPSNLKKDGSWHQVQVQVKGFGNRVRVREGYVDF
jgi:Ca-activated chloride channel family protein